MNFQLLKGSLTKSLRYSNIVESSLRPRYLSHTSRFSSSLNLDAAKNHLNSNRSKFIFYSSSNYFTTLGRENIKFISTSGSFLKSNNSRMPPINNLAGESVEKHIKENKIVIFSKTTCPFCVRAKDLLSNYNVNIHIVLLDEVENGGQMQDYLESKTGQRTVPNIFINNEHVGGFDNLTKLQSEGRLYKLVSDDESSSSVDLKPKPAETIEHFCNDLIKKNKVMIFSKETCPFCTKVKELFTSLNQQYTAIELDKMDEGTAIRDYLFEKTGQKTFPNVYVNGTHLGGCDNTLTAHSEGRLEKLLNKSEETESDETYDYDFVVIGGGSGGLAASKMAATLGAKTAVLDFVDPTPIGTKWGLGGTCVNVGCIPKKLMHQSAILGESLKDSREFGWQTPENVQHSWQTMKNNIQDHIGSLNWGYRVQLRDKNVEYINGKGTFLDPHKIHVVQKNKKVREITAKKICVAVGGRPKYPSNIIGVKENTITSDDLFSLDYSPGKTLCVGASYVSLECAGFLKGIGLDVTVMVRSILLRGFDQQMANIIGDYMEKHGINFIRNSVPTEIVKVKDPEPGKSAGEYIVKYKDNDGNVSEETYNTVVLAVGRDALTDQLNLDKAGVKVNEKNKKIFTTFEQTNVDHIYAIGDVVDETTANGRALELTPVAIQAGQLLSKRIFGNSDVKMDYHNVPTTVFTPIEYGAIGYAEEEAIAKYGEENIEVYHQYFWPLEWTVARRPNDVCYGKLICNKLDQERVVGLHVAGPNAGEITQGYAVALKLRATKKDFDMTVGIHPTCSESFTTMNVTKASGQDVVGAGC